MLRNPVVLLFAICASLHAQIPSGITPFGLWPICEVPALAMSPICAGFVPGNEGYLLVIRAKLPETVAYLYTAIATLSTGEVISRSGVLARTAGDTAVVLYFGGPAEDFKITVEDLGVIGPRAIR